MQRESQAQIFTNLANSRIRDLHDELVRGEGIGVECEECEGPGRPKLVCGG